MSKLRQRRRTDHWRLSAVASASILAMLAAIALPVAAQEAPQPQMLFDCETLDGVRVSSGENWPDTTLELNNDPAYVSQGDASLHLFGVSPEDAPGNSYLAIDIDVGGVDLSGKLLRFDAWTAHPETTQALYVRAYDNDGDCVLSFLNWQSPLGDGSKKAVELIRGFGDLLRWEPKRVEADDLSNVQRLRFYIGTHGKGAPLGFYLDNIRVVDSQMRSFEDVHEPKERVLQTPIVIDGQPRAIIVAPAGEEWQSVASQLQAMVRSLTGAELQVFTPEQVDDAQLRETTAIIVGNVVDNRTMLYLYSHEYVFADQFYPGDGGYEVRTVHDPWGTGHNVLSVGAGDPEGARAGIEALSDSLKEGDDLALGQVTLVELGPAASERWGRALESEPDEEWFDAQKTAAERDLDTGRHGGLFSRATTIGRTCQLTRKPGYARAFVWMLQRAQEHRDSDPDTYGGPWGMDSDFRSYSIFPQWDVVEECPALSDDERLEATRILFRWITEAVAPPASGVVGREHVRHNHQTFPSLGCMYAGEYFQKYYDAFEGKRWLKIADECFQYQSQCFKPHEDCNGYQWLTLYHTMRYALARPDLTYFENGNARRDADYAIMCMDNLGYQVTYGDTGAYVGWFSEMPFLHGAEWYYRDGRYCWATEKKFEVSDRRDLSWFGAKTTPREPANLIGAEAFPLDDYYYDSFGGEDHIPREHAVDKVVFRDGFDPDDQYLLLDGLNNGGHKHYDGNSISRMSANGRIWLADASYMLSLPKFHSTALVLRDGQSETLPPFCELEHMRDLPEVGFSETALRDYAGVDWRRNIFWLKGDWFVVADEMQAKQAGDYSFRILWQTIGQVEPGDDGIAVEQDGQHCAIRMTPELRFMLTDDEEYGQSWSGYPHIDEPVVRRLQGVWSGRLEKGEGVTLFTLLHPSGERASQLRLARLRPNQAVVRGGDSEPVTVAVGGADGEISLPGGARAQAHGALLKPGLLALFDASSIEYQYQPLDFPGGRDVQMALGEGGLMHLPAGRTAEPSGDRQTDYYPEIAQIADEAVREMIAAAVAAAPEPDKPTPAGADAPTLRQLWSYGETLESYLLTGNDRVFGAVDAGLELSCRPEPRPHNVFDSPDEKTNVLANITDGSVQSTENCTQWDDDEQVAIHLGFDAVYPIESLIVKAWFATSSSKDKLFQVHGIRVEASDDGFDDDVREVVNFTDTQMHGNWGAPGHAPHAYEFEDLNTHARNLRIRLTPRPGTAVYIAEIEVWGGGEELAERLKTDLPAHTFDSMWSADLDGDGEAEVIAGSTNGRVYAFDGDGSILWEAETGQRVNSVCAARLSADGPPAVIAGCMGAVVKAFDAAGTELWTFEVPRYKHTGHVRTVFPAKLSGGGEAVIAGADSWRYYAIDAEGNELWHEESVHRSTAGAAADLDGDGRDEVICGTEYYWWPVVSPDGERLFNYRTSTGPGVNDALAADLTGDGTPEVVFGGQDSHVHTVSAAGELLWKFNTGDEVSSLAAVEHDDGPAMLIVGSLSFNLYALDGEGQIIWRQELGYPIVDIAAFEGAGGPRIAAVTSDGRLLIANPGEGEVVGRFGLPGAPIGVIAADIDGDGAQELVVSTVDGNLTAVH